MCFAKSYFFLNTLCIFLEKENLRLPGQHLIDVSVGVLRTNSLVETSYSAVVSNPRTWEPEKYL